MIQMTLSLAFFSPLFFDLFENMFLLENDSKGQHIIFSYLFSKIFHLNPRILEPLDPHQSTNSMGDDPKIIISRG